MTMQNYEDLRISPNYWDNLHIYVTNGGYNTCLTPGIILTTHVRRKERMVVTIPMKRNLPSSSVTTRPFK